MEHAPLRPVPARPAGPIDPATATREVGAWLPLLSPPASQAFALVALAERPRAEVAETLGVSQPELSALLAAARKELRQTTDTLGGSGWCERAERLISDRLDGSLDEIGARRLDVHLRNCPRCVEHERRLVQATDALILSLGGPIGAGGHSAPPPLTEAQPDEAPDGAPPQQEPPVEAPPQQEPPVEAPPEELPPEEQTPQEPGGPPLQAVPDGPTDEDLAAAEDSAAAPTAEDIAAAAELLVAVRTRRQVAAALAWNALIALAVLRAVAVIAITVAGALGAHL
jgi:hypothetical protein